MGYFRQVSTDVFARNTSKFSFSDDNFSKFQCIFMKLGMPIDIVEICLGIANWQIWPIFDRVICSWHDNGRVLSFQVFIYFALCCVHTDKKI